MKIAFCLYKYFPYGGLQRDFMRIAKECVDRGHQVTAYCLKWRGEKPDWLEVQTAPVKGFSSPLRYRRFYHWLSDQLAAKPVDVVFGFNKMPGLDIYYCADPCFENKARNLRAWWYKYTPRYRHFSRYEQAVFKPGGKTQILMISEVQVALFKKFYGTEDGRMEMLPPGISRDRRAPENAGAVRREFRREFALADSDLLLLQVGSGFRTKGVDRSIRALASLPEGIRSKTQLFVIGEDDPREFLMQAKAQGMSARITFFQGRDDIPRFLQGADLLVHPAYAENTGTVLLEAVVAGLPVLVTDVCGYARYVEEAGAGVLVPTPFSQEKFNQQLCEMLEADRSLWKKKALKYADSADIYDMPLRVAEYIEQFAPNAKS
ncbi:MAG: glycosyltransferase family 4 protein [Porticoccaceae bacterium]|nr:glycosyltransferase family 4 protein [Pseudomonadales bacterium]